MIGLCLRWHIYFLPRKNLWIKWSYGRWITDMDDTNGASKINSIQNGFLLQLDIHQSFDQYPVFVNPDVGLKSIRKVY
ncbi:hypothetical protein BDZ91DRAFT_722680 [Kalaharituber pfeilii]|nr:hypothetical protein BDZ91DRAFT_722680 [Kalaharituber pfeilii]